MERIIDKVIIVVCCGTVLILMPQSTVFVTGLLVVLMISALQEVRLMPECMQRIALFAYLVLTIPVATFAVFIPLIAYDCMRMKFWPLRLCWLLPLFLNLSVVGSTVFIYISVVAFIALALSWRTRRVENERMSFEARRDELHESSIMLKRQNRDLRMRQEYEVKVATLDERARIAREIHDNVGHLLTRSVLQVEAAQVVFADDACVVGEFERIGITLHEAFDTVRASVHDLHDDAFDLDTQLYAIARDASLELKVEHTTEYLPEPLAYGFIAIIKEAVANSTKHGDASKMQVTLRELPALWQLTIKDNGSKNPLMTAGAQEKIMANGLGLKSMEERVCAVGGLFRIDYDRGFKIFITVPKNTD